MTDPLRQALDAYADALAPALATTLRRAAAPVPPAGIAPQAAAAAVPGRRCPLQRRHGHDRDPCAADLLHIRVRVESHRRDLRRGLATLCIGGGMGIATVVEVV